MQWHITTQAHQQPTIREFAEFWAASERTAYRSQAEFRTAFPGEKSAARLAWVCRHYDLTTGWRGLAEFVVETEPLNARNRAI
jgi:hypothetical protein